MIWFSCTCNGQIANDFVKISGQIHENHHKQNRKYFFNCNSSVDKNNKVYSLNSLSDIKIHNLLLRASWPSDDPMPRAASKAGIAHLPAPALLAVRGIVARTSRLQTRSDAYLCCVLSHEFSRKRETTRSLPSPFTRESLHESKFWRRPINIAK